jgi:hypothetical protein
MEPIDIWRAAAQFMKTHGSEAEIHASIRADELLEAGDLEGFKVWQRVVRAIEELRRTAPPRVQDLN